MLHNNTSNFNVVLEATKVFVSALSAPGNLSRFLKTFWQLVFIQSSKSQTELCSCSIEFCLMYSTPFICPECTPTAGFVGMLWFPSDKWNSPLGSYCFYLMCLAEWLHADFNNSNNTATLCLQLTQIEAYVNTQQQELVWCWMKRWGPDLMGVFPWTKIPILSQWSDGELVPIDQWYWPLLHFIHHLLTL